MEELQIVLVKIQGLEFGLQVVNQRVRQVCVRLGDIPIVQSHDMGDFIDHGFELKLINDPFGHVECNVSLAVQSILFPLFLDFGIKDLEVFSVH